MSKPENMPWTKAGDLGSEDIPVLTLENALKAVADSYEQGKKDGRMEERSRIADCYLTRLDGFVSDILSDEG